MPQMVISEKLQQLRDFIDKLQERENPDSYLIAILHKAQSLYGYIDKAVVEDISVRTKISLAKIWGVVTFYHFFKLKPAGEYEISVCLGTACYVKGAERILDAIKETIGVGIGDTTEDKLFTLQETRCIGACGIAPVATINGKVYGELSPNKIVKIINDIKAKK
ncbi:MAG: NAD(P)H-dependent oxidoreductase subunit E [Candidatus Margulisiibacteriota bacterium]|nr:MAG: hypothetical protein A2X43_06445 [Candidatus Margulisbacteria bacterium GWD2_39_127]OGI05589.1 MAG: hypothetical protein A2X42_08825 [Candidatus Margulisbacteria bacterium GWF2_38_17]OGI07546.1 MAG: hypothetical protein A2X41_08730 [Candidatus Margulisbacteria bacterium GWE2_39_32]PZM84885.1 MAG: NAD(P)H-dependent oxidoreductase subunit E [Candidatus Margulisiibacteriota bacterium]HAR64029.1 NAD(P)H-dependent oxidoreductase subunit E [Candidatus Margulisiibacteriota bacterium]